MPRALFSPEADEPTLNADVAMMPTQPEEATTSDHTPTTAVAMETVTASTDVDDTVMVDLF